MFISNQAILEFREIYKNEYGIELDEKEARRKAIKVLKVMEIIYKPLKVTNILKGGDIKNGNTING